MISNGLFVWYLLICFQIQDHTVSEIQQYCIVHEVHILNPPTPSEMREESRLMKQDINLRHRLHLLLGNPHFIINMGTVFSNEQLLGEYNWQRNDEAQLAAVHILLDPNVSLLPN